MDEQQEMVARLMLIIRLGLETNEIAFFIFSITSGARTFGDHLSGVAQP